jgi:glycosyltransferase involved in cell wall biosynthesis
VAGSALDESAILAADWYAERIGPPFVGLSAALTERFPGWLVRLASRVGPLRGLLMFALARRARAVAVVHRDRGAATLLVLAASARGRSAPVVVLEFIPRYVSSLGPLFRLWSAGVLRPALRRGAARLHVLSARELDRYSAEFGLERSRFARVEWPLSSGVAEPPTGPRSGVLASGRAWCDWPTLFAAARAEWGLTVVCRRRDLGEVRRLNRGRLAEVLCEVPQTEHDRLLRRAAVFVIPLREGAPSAGQVRLLEATDAGTPIVVSRLAVLEEYADGESTLAVQPGDPRALSAAVDRLLASHELRERLVAARRARAAGTSYDAYFASIRRLVEETAR